MRRTVSSWEDVAELHTHDGNDKYVSGEDTMDAFWQTLATGNFSERNKDELRLMYGYRRTRTHKIRRPSLAQAFFVASLLPVVSQIFKQPRADLLTQSRYLLFRRMIRTEGKKYLGLVSGDVRRGDEVWLLEGSKIPLIIRRQREGYGRLIGDAYIHGIMYGEAFRIDDCEDLILE